MVPCVADRRIELAKVDPRVPMAGGAAEVDIKRHEGEIGTNDAQA